MLERQPGRLEQAELPEPEPGPGQVAIRVGCCGVCRTDLHILDGELPEAKLPLVPGHQIVGTVEATGEGVEGFAPGDRIGVPWLGWTCGECEYCRSGRENLCPRARFTGYTLDGGYAERAVADARYCFRLPEGFEDEQAAPLLCAGLIGYRALRMTGEATRLGLYGFGSSAHIVCQIAAHEGRRVFAFTRPGDQAGQDFARSLGAEWAGDSDRRPPEPLDAVIVFAPVGALMVTALEASAPGATIVSAGIHMSDIPSFPYRLLWQERSLRSVANLTRRDGEELFDLIARGLPLRTEVQTRPLVEANTALDDLRAARHTGSLVLEVAPAPRQGSLLHR